MAKVVYADDTVFYVTALSGGRVTLLAVSKGASVTNFFSRSEASALAAALNDIAARSAPVCDEAEE